MVRKLATTLIKLFKSIILKTRSLSAKNMFKNLKIIKKISHFFEKIKFQLLKISYASIILVTPTWLFTVLVSRIFVLQLNLFNLIFFNVVIILILISLVIMARKNLFLRDWILKIIFYCFNKLLKFVSSNFFLKYYNLVNTTFFLSFYVLVSVGILTYYFNFSSFFYFIILYLYGLLALSARLCRLLSDQLIWFRDLFINCLFKSKINFTFFWSLNPFLNFFVTILFSNSCKEFEILFKEKVLFPNLDSYLSQKLCFSSLGEVAGKIIKQTISKPCTPRGIAKNINFKATLTTPQIDCLIKQETSLSEKMFEERERSDKFFRYRFLPVAGIVLTSGFIIYELNEFEKIKSNERIMLEKFRLDREKLELDREKLRLDREKLELEKKKNSRYFSF